MADWVDIEIARMARRAEETGRAVEHRLGGIGRVTGEARSADGMITVVVSPGGMLRDVQLTPAALRLGPERIAREVVALAERATRQAAARLHRMLGPVVSPDVLRALSSLGLAPPEPTRDRAEERTWLRRAL